MGLRRAIFGRLRAGPVNRSAPKTPGNLPLSAAPGQAESTARMGTGGGSATGYKRSPELTGRLSALLCSTVGLLPAIDTTTSPAAGCGSFQPTNCVTKLQLLTCANATKSSWHARAVCDDVNRQWRSAVCS